MLGPRLGVNYPRNRKEEGLVETVGTEEEEGREEVIPGGVLEEETSVRHTSRTIQATASLALVEEEEGVAREVDLGVSNGEALLLEEEGNNSLAARLLEEDVAGEHQEVHLEVR